MLAPVVVQGLPPAEDVRFAVLSSCSAALGQRPCVADGDLNDPGVEVTVAFVAGAEASSRRARVTLELRRLREITTLRRDIRFADEDPPVERSRAIGLVIAALVGESEGAGSRSDGENGAVARDGASARPNWIAALAFAGPGLDRGSPRVGGMGAVGVGLTAPFFLAASASYAIRPANTDGLTLRWVTMGLGAGVVAALPSADLALRTSLEMNLQYISARLAGSTLATGSGDRLVPGLSVGVAGTWPASTPWCLVAGANISSFAGGTAIHLDQQNLGSSRWLGYAGFLGVAWSFR